MWLRRHLVVLLLLLSLCALQGCNNLSSDEIATTADIDPAGGLTREDYLALRHREHDGPTTADAAKDTETLPVQEKAIPPIPEMPAVQSTPISPMNKLVSISVSDSVPVREVLMELVNKTGANLELDPRVSGTVIISAHDQPFGQVLRRICMLAGLRYTMDGAFIHIEPDDPYQKTDLPA